MTDSTREILRRALLSAYGELKGLLAARLGSPDLAREALHETWLKLERTPDITPVYNPKAYLYRAALNTAVNMRRTERRHVSDTDREIILNLRDETPGPDRIAAARSDLDRMEQVLSDLTERQKSLFFGYFVEDLDQVSLARRHGISLRTVQSELQIVTERMRRLNKIALRNSSTATVLKLGKPRER